MPELITPPKRPGRSGSKYFAEDKLDETVKLLKDNPDKFIGKLSEPVDTQVKARNAAYIWKAKLADEFPGKSIATRVWSDGDEYTFALAVVDKKERKPAEKKSVKKTDEAVAVPA